MTFARIIFTVAALAFSLSAHSESFCYEGLCVGASASDAKALLLSKGIASPNLDRVLETYPVCKPMGMSSGMFKTRSGFVVSYTVDYIGREGKGQHALISQIGISMPGPYTDAQASLFQQQFVQDHHVVTVDGGASPRSYPNPGKFLRSADETLTYDMPFFPAPFGRGLSVQASLPFRAMKDWQRLERFASLPGCAIMAPARL